MGAGHPAGSRDHLFPCPCPLVIQAEWDHSAPRRSPRDLHPGLRLQWAPHLWGTRAQPPTSRFTGARCFWYMDARYLLESEEDLHERHPASPFAPQHFTEEEPREEDGSFNAFISLGVLWPELGREGAFCTFCSLRALHKPAHSRNFLRGPGPGPCCPLGAAAVAEHR